MYTSSIKKPITEWCVTIKRDALLGLEIIFLLTGYIIIRKEKLQFETFNYIRQELVVIFYGIYI